MHGSQLEISTNFLNYWLVKFITPIYSTVYFPPIDPRFLD